MAIEVIEAKSAVTQTYVHACDKCGASVGDPCRNPDGSLLGMKGHLAVHGVRYATFLSSSTGRARARPVAS